MTWMIVLTADDPRVELSGSGWLEILPEDADPNDALEALEGWAETIQRLGFVPDSGDWRNQAPCHIGSRHGRLSFRVRCDTFEWETDTGSTVGAGHLRAIQVSE